MHSFGVGQLGVGGIAEVHRSGYEFAGIDVVAGADVSEESLTAFGDACPGAAVHRSVDDLVADPAVDVVDVAVPHHPEARHRLLRTVLEAGKPALVQKPLATTYDDALKLCEWSEDLGVPVMVNQNFCFAPNLLGLQHRVCVERTVGSPFYAQMRTEAKFDTDRHPWYGKDQRWWTGAVGVHHLALAHHLFGPPESVYGLVGHEPGQPGVTGEDGYGHIALKYSDGMQALLVLSGTYYGSNPVPHGSEHIWVQGSQGALECQPDSDLTLCVRRNGERRVVDRESLPRLVEGDWFPYGFGLAMRHFRDALAAGTDPWCSIQDNLFVVAAVEAVYRSAAQGAEVRLESVMGDRWDASWGPGSSRTMPTWAADHARASR